MPTYTLNELIEEMEPQRERDRTLAKSVIKGLTEYAAGLRRKGTPEDQAKIPALRQMIGNFADYWVLSEEPGGMDAMGHQKNFDHRMETANTKTKRLPPLGDQIDTLLGLYRYAEDLIHNFGSEAREDVADCRALFQEVKAYWKLSAPLLDQLYDKIDTTMQEQILHEKDLEMGGIQ